ncbi:MAG: GspE/PulE family protein [Planctomycetota bacterium]
MSATDAPSQNLVSSPVTARDPRVAAAVRAASTTAFQPLGAGLRELPVEAVVRILEDLQVTETARSLVVEPVSGYLPHLLAKLAFDVDVVVSDTGRAETLRRELVDAAATNVRVQTFLQDREDGGHSYDRMVVVQPANEDLGPVLLGHLAPHGRAVWSVDRSMPSRRVRRLLRVADGLTLEEDLDLVHYMPLLGDMLVDAGVALRQEVAEAVKAARQSGRLLGEQLLARGSVREPDLYRALAEQQQLPFASAREVLARVDAQLVQQLPRTFLEHYRFVPVCATDGRVWIASPDTSLPLGELRSVFEGAEIVRELICPSDLERIWSFLDHQRLTSGIGAAAVAADREGPRTPLPTSTVEATAAGDVVGELLSRALARSATAVHLEVRRDEVTARARVAGALMPFEAELSLAAVTELVAMLAGRAGRAWEVDGRLVDVSCSDEGTVAGRSVTVQLDEASDGVVHLEDLGLHEHVLAGLRAALHEPRGVVLVAGPARAGRSTTMQAALDALANGYNKVVACGERPVSVGGEVSFARVVGDDGETAARVRSLAAQDVDVLGVDCDGEGATLAAAVRAAHRGKLVVMTGAGNDAADALQQLIEGGLDGNAIATNVNAVVVQHLAQRLCEGCRREVEPDASLVGELFVQGVPDGFVAYEANGCDDCCDTGVMGQVPVVEFLPNGPALRRALRRGVAPHDLGPIARQNGLRSLIASAIDLVQRGEVSLSEMMRVVSAEQREGAEELCGRGGSCS